MLNFSTLRCGNIALRRITQENADAVRQMFSSWPDSEYMLGEINESYLPTFDDQGRQTLYGFYALLDNVLAGLSLIAVDSWERLRGFTGADTLLHMRGRGVAPRSKPHLFYVGFELLRLHRIETSCNVSNHASKRSLDKTTGLQLEGTLRGWIRHPDGTFEDEYRYAIIRPDWERLYDKSEVKVIL